MKRKIALLGKAGSGKDYVYNKLKETLESSNGMIIKRFAFADPVKKHISTLLNFNKEEQQLFISDEDFKNHSLVSVSQNKMIAKSDVNHTHSCWSKVWTADTFNLFVTQGKIRYDDIDEMDIYMSLREYIVFYGTFIMQKCLGRRVWCHTIFNSPEYQKTIDNPNGMVVITDVRFPHEFNECESKDFVFIRIESEDTKNGETCKNIAESYTDMFNYDFIFRNNKKDANEFDNELKRLLLFLKSEK